MQRPWTGEIGMKYTKEERQEIGRQIYEHELTCRQAAEEYGIHIHTAKRCACTHVRPGASIACLTRHARGIIEKRCIGGFCSPLEYGAGLDQSEIQRGRSFAECDPGRSIPPDRIGSAGANWNGNIKARTTTPGIVNCNPSRGQGNN